MSRPAELLAIIGCAAVGGVLAAVALDAPPLLAVPAVLAVSLVAAVATRRDRGGRRA